MPAAEIKVRAERRLGEMLREQKQTSGMNTGGWANRESCGSSSEPQVPTLAEVGIDKKLSMRSQQLAAMPSEHFEVAIASAKETAKAVSTTMAKDGIDRILKRKIPGFPVFDFDRFKTGVAGTPMNRGFPGFPVFPVWKLGG